MKKKSGQEIALSDKELVLIRKGNKQALKHFQALAEVVLRKFGWKTIPPLAPDGIYEIVIRPGNQKTTVKITKKGNYTRPDGGTGGGYVYEDPPGVCRDNN